MTSSAELIEQLVCIAFGASDRRMQAQFRENLRMLAEVAKMEQRAETTAELPDRSVYTNCHSMH